MAEDRIAGTVVEQHATMETLFIETTRLSLYQGYLDIEIYQEVEYNANERELPPVAEHPPPFSFENLLAFLDQRRRVLWLNADVFLTREDPNVDYFALQEGAAVRGYIPWFCLGLSKEDSIAVYQKVDDAPRATAQKTAAYHFLVDLFCLGLGDSAYIKGVFVYEYNVDAVLSRFVSQRSETISTLNRLEMFDVSLTANSMQALITLSEASEGRIEIAIHNGHLARGAEDAFVSFLQGGHGPTELSGGFLGRRPRVLSRGLRRNTRLQKLEIETRHREEDIAEIGRGLADNESLECLTVCGWNTHHSRFDAALRTVCRSLVAHPALHTLALAGIFKRRMSLEQQNCRAQYIQQLLASNTVLTDVRLNDEDERNIDDAVFNKFLWPHLGKLRFRGKFNAIMHDPNRIKLLAPALGMLLDTRRDDVNLAHFFVTVNQGALVEAVCALVADRTRVTGQVHARAPDEYGSADDDSSEAEVRSSSKGRIYNVTPKSYHDPVFMKYDINPTFALVLKRNKRFQPKQDADAASLLASETTAPNSMTQPKLPIRKRAMHKALLPILILLAGLLVATVQLRGRSKAVSQASIVQMPLIGGSESKREGPWPECVGMTGDACKRLIEANAQDVRGNVSIVGEDMMVTMDFRTDRVRIFVDSDGNVARTPSRG